MDFYIYTLLDLRNFCISPQIPAIKKTIDMLLAEEKGIDGGINPLEYFTGIAGA
jgi:hypothetical protein